jgi:hypothetical protein
MLKELEAKNIWANYNKEADSVGLHALLRYGDEQEGRD